MDLRHSAGAAANVRARWQTIAMGRWVSPPVPEVESPRDRTAAGAPKLGNRQGVYFLPFFAFFTAFFAAFSSITAWAAPKRAIGTRYGEQET